MPIPSVPPFLPSAIGEAADVLDIVAETPPGTGALSYKSGWPALTALPLEAGGVAPQREYFNAVNKLLSQHTCFQQAGAVYPWSNTLDYPANATVQGSDGATYRAVKPSGPDTPNADGGGMVGPVDPVGDESGHWQRAVTLADGVTTTVNEDGLLSALGGNLRANDDEWLTESGEWIVKVTGWHEITIIDGGDGASSRGNLVLEGGKSGLSKTFLKYLTKNTVISVTVGAAGKGYTQPSGQPLNYVLFRGGKTIFGDLDTGLQSPTSIRHVGQAMPRPNSIDYSVYVEGGGYSAMPYVDADLNGIGYGSGGSAMLAVGQTDAILGSGYQGAVCLRFWNPAKAADPLPEPALLSARRMAVSATDAPATVNLYDPETRMGSVWRKKDAEAKLAEGFITQKAWLEICAQKGAEAYAAWLASPDTEAERFDMLRAARDAKLAEHDVQVVQLQRQARAGADVADDLAAWDAYAVALCDLPAQEGAPWDGGGEATPWPERPATIKA